MAVESSYNGLNLMPKLLTVGLSNSASISCLFIFAWFQNGGSLTKVVVVVAFVLIFNHLFMSFCDAFRVKMLQSSNLRKTFNQITR